MWSGRNGMTEKAVVGWRSMARKSGMMFMTEGAENLLSYMLLVRRMVRSVVSVVWGMVRSVV
jgi:hypothetical protein